MNLIDMEKYLRSPLVVFVTRKKSVAVANTVQDLVSALSELVSLKKSKEIVESVKRKKGLTPEDRAANESRSEDYERRKAPAWLAAERALSNIGITH